MLLHFPAKSCSRLDSLESSNAVSKGAKQPKRNSWEVDFVHVDLQASDKPVLASWDTKLEQTFDCLSGLGMEGWKISLARDERNDCTIASLTSPKPEGAGRQVCLSARGPDMLQSMRVLAFKVLVKLDGDLSSLADHTEGKEQWG